MQNKPFITGIEGLVLQEKEISFIKNHKPWGIILFQRNCDNPEQLRKLTDHIKEIYGTEEVPILIDQEGGRVQRLKEAKGWRKYPSAAYFYETYLTAPAQTLELVRLNASLQASELRKMGITVNCAPMIDVRDSGAHDIIGDRAFSDTPKEVAEYGRAVMLGHMDQSILPIIKHIPGHGRARCDSHKELPTVPEALNHLTKDFAPFIALKDAPMGMTAHILYSALDAQNCATLSPSIIKNIIRGIIGFTGILMSDDVSMKALSGDLGRISQDILNAGCDLILHCNGNFEEMEKIANAIEKTCPMLELRTNKMWNNLMMSASPRSDDDLLEEYQELSAKLLKARSLSMRSA